MGSGPHGEHQHGSDDHGRSQAACLLAVLAPHFGCDMFSSHFIPHFVVVAFGPVMATNPSPSVRRTNPFPAVMGSLGTLKSPAIHWPFSPAHHSCSAVAKGEGQAGVEDVT